MNKLLKYIKSKDPRIYLIENVFILESVQFVVLEYLLLFLKR